MLTDWGPVLIADDDKKPPVPLIVPPLLLLLNWKGREGLGSAIDVFAAPEVKF